jgi:hypothetical protein
MMKKYLCFCVVMFLAGYAFSQSSGTPPSKVQIEQAAKILGVSTTDLQKWVDGKFVSVPTGVQTVTAIELYQAYESSAPRADRAYKGKEIRLTGIVSKIEEIDDANFNKRYCISLDTGNDWDLVKVFFDNAYIDQIFDVNIGQQVTVIATVIEKRSIYVFIDHAKIL